VQAGAFGAHIGKYVAVMNKRFLGAAEDPIQLECECAQAMGVHPAEIVVEFIDDGAHP
jgi:hypothetical protein